MRALVTGGLGFIGSNLTRRLLEDGHDVLVIDRASGDLPGAQVMNADLRDVYRAPEADVIFHLAGPVGPVYLMEQAGEIVEEVVTSTMVVREWALERDIPLVFASTSETYGEQGLPIPEDRPRIIPPGWSGRMEYPVAKLAAELMLLNTPGLDSRILLPFNVAGGKQSAAKGFVLPRLIEQARKGEPLTVYLPGTQRRAFTHIDDFVDGFVRAWTHGYPQGRWNLGNPACDASICELAQLIVDVTGSKSPIHLVDPTTLHGAAFREAPDKIPDITKARAELGWNPTRTLRQVVEDAARW
jgi:nucleoside-diphosphate-sugar epimerase